MDPRPDPFRVLALPYDARPEDVRRAFRQLARGAHPDRGGSAESFREIRAAYDLLTSDLDGARRRWQPVPSQQRRPSAGPDPRLFPTCPVIVGRSSEGRRLRFRLDARPAGWLPSASAPVAGVCLERVPASGGTPAFGVWRVPLDDGRARYVFGPPGE